MGEEEEKKKEEKKEVEKKEEDPPPEIVLKVDMHCEGCARKVAKSLKKCEGVEEVKTDSKLRKVVVKGKEVDPTKLCERIQKKTGRKTEIISPLPKPPEEEKKDEGKDAPPEEKKEEPKPITVVLKVRMHCDSCAQVLQKRIKKMDGVETVVADLPNDQITVTGFIDPEKLAENVSRRTRRRAFIVKNEEKKVEEEEEKKEEKSEGEKKEEEQKSEEDKDSDAKKIEYLAPRYYTEYAYPPQVFSDENPNACSIM